MPIAKEATLCAPLLVKDENENEVPLVDLAGKFYAGLPEIGGKFVKTPITPREKRLKSLLMLKLRSD